MVVTPYTAGVLGGADSTNGLTKVSNPCLLIKYPIARFLKSPRSHLKLVSSLKPKDLIFNIVYLSFI